MEQNNAAPTEHEGERYLRLLGLENLADNIIPGTDKQARDFLDICGEHSRPPLIGLESLSHDDPRYEPTRNALREYIQQFITPAEG